PVEIEADKAVVHRCLIDGVARTPFENGIEGLGGERFNGEDQRALRLLGRSGCAAQQSQQNGKRRHAAAAERLHQFLPNGCCWGCWPTIEASTRACQLPEWPGRGARLPTSSLTSNRRLAFQRQRAIRFRRCIGKAKGALGCAWGALGVRLGCSLA